MLTEAHRIHAIYNLKVNFFQAPASVINEGVGTHRKTKETPTKTKLGIETFAATAEAGCGRKLNETLPMPL